MTKETRAGLARRLANPHEVYRTGITGAGRAEREARVKRLVLTGALGAFVAFFALAVAVDLKSSPATDSTPGSPAPIVIYDNAGSSGPASVVAASQVRTRTS